MKDDHAIGERDDHLHDVLDDDERDAGAVNVAHQLDGGADLGRRQARHGLVEQQHLGLGCQRPGDLEALAAGRAEAARGASASRAEADVVDAPARALSRAAAAPG